MHGPTLEQSRERTVATGVGRSAMYDPQKCDHGAPTAWKNVAGPNI